MAIQEVVRLRIRELRSSRGFTQEELCERAGISVDAVARIESGSRVPTLPTLELIARALGVTVSALVRLEDKAPSPQSRSIQRVISLLEGEPERLQVAVERALRAGLRALRDSEGSGKSKEAKR